jgi:hypothetical protein
LISSPVLAKLGASTPIWGSLQDNSKNLSQQLWYSHPFQGQRGSPNFSLTLYLSTFEYKEALTTDSWGLHHHWEVGMNVIRQGQAGSSGDGLKEQHKHAREHRTKISWTNKKGIIYQRVLSSFGSNVHEERPKKWNDLNLDPLVIGNSDYPRFR